MYMTIIRASNIFKLPEKTVISPAISTGLNPTYKKFRLKDESSFSNELNLRFHMKIKNKNKRTPTYYNNNESDNAAILDNIPSVNY